MGISKQKLAYPYEYFNSIEVYHKPVDNLKKKDFSSKLKNKCPEYDEIERTKENINLFGFKIGEEITKLNCKSDVILLADVVENFAIVSFEEYGFNPLYCVSLPGFTYQCALKYTDNNLQTLQDKDLVLLIENNIRGGISSVMSDRYVKSDENKKITYMDATNLYGHSMSQMLPYDEIKIEKDICLGEILNTPDDNEIGYFLEFDLKYPENIKKQRIFHFVQRIRKLILINTMIIRT